MKKHIAIVAILLILSILLCGCASSDKKALLGTWKFTQENVTLRMTFEDDGTGTMSASGISADFTYTAKNGHLSIIPDGSAEDIMEAEYSINGDELTMITEGDVSTVFKREK